VHRSGSLANNPQRTCAARTDPMEMLFVGVYMSPLPVSLIAMRSLRRLKAQVFIGSLLMLEQGRNSDEDKSFECRLPTADSENRDRM
jgi:hypothetical protein